MKIAHISVLAALVVAPQVTFAQAERQMAPSALPGGPSASMSGAPSGATTTTTTTTGGDAGTISNIGGASSVSGDTLPGDTSTTDTLTDTSLTKGELPSTGGEPQLMLMAGLVLAACGLLLRRKMAGQAV